MHSKASAPLRYSLCLVVMRYIPIIPFIILLLFSSSPATVAFTVAFIIIYTVYRVTTTRAFPYVFIKTGKRVNPVRTYGDATPSVVNIGRIIGVNTSSFKATPCGIFRGVSKTMCSSACVIAVSTRYVREFFEIPTKGYCMPTAITDTVPPYPAIFGIFRVSVYNCEVSVCFIDKIYHYIFSIVNISHKDRYVAPSYGAGIQPLSLATEHSIP